MSYYSISVTNTKTHALLYMYSLFLLCFSAVTGATTFDLQTLNTNNFKFLGDAHMLNNTFRLTQGHIAPNYGAGRVLYDKPVRFRRPEKPNPTSFATHFSFSILTLNPNSVGGGIAFVISPDHRSIGSAGGFLGIPAGAVSIEFDTIKDVEFKDVNGNHVGLDINTVASLQVANLDSVNVSLRSGELIHSWVDYSGPSHRLKVFISNAKTKPKLPVLAVTIDLYPYVNEFMYVGFSGSTQGSTEVHSIASWIFASTFDDPNRKLGPNCPLPPPKSPLNPMPMFMPPTISTQKHDNQLKQILGLLGAFFSLILLGGGITIYFTHGKGDEKGNCNICNWCSNLNNA